MPIDIGLLRTSPQIVVDSETQRFHSPSQVYRADDLDRKLRKLRYELDSLNAKRNALIKEIRRETDDQVLEDKQILEEQISKLKQEIDVTKVEFDECFNSIGNILDPEVPVAKSETENVTIDTWGDTTTKKKFPHHQLLSMIDGYDQPRGVKIAGNRGYFLKGIGVRLNQALIAYATDFLVDRGYIPLQTPLFMKPEVMKCTAQLEQFDEELYKVTERCSATASQSNEYYLIATSEQPISAYHQEEKLHKKDLPLRYAGVSQCFRKETGRHGTQTRGIYRVHQFEKVEQFCITTPEDSQRVHREMTKNASDFLESLNIPYRAVLIVSAALNNAAAKKIDLEAWFPGQEEFGEVVSSSNCTDYQSRALNIHLENTKEYPHMLNATLCATTRTICAILENYQTDEGVIVPTVLRSYLRGLDFIPFN